MPGKNENARVALTKNLIDETDKRVRIGVNRVGSINIPGYKIVKTLGVGGQATVYLAIQEGFDREIALKVMSPALAADPSFGERFLREAKIVAKLRHPGIVTVYDVGEHDGFYYLAMEFLPNTDLRRRISAGIKAKEALEVVMKVAKALDFAHKKGYIHRDVKSENILFREDDEPVLTDFGIAKASNSLTHMTQQGKLIGTPQYMSPEQCRGRPLDGRSDLYSLGVILHEMLTQSVPYDSEDSVAVCLQHVTKPIPRLPVRQKHYQWLLDRMMAKKPEDRFADGLELAKEVAQFLAGDVSSVKDSRATLTATREENLEAIFHEDESFGAGERMVQQDESRSGRWIWIIASVLVISAVGYLQQHTWLPWVKQTYAELAGVAGAESSSSVQESTKNTLRSGQNTVTSTPQTAEAKTNPAEQLPEPAITHSVTSSVQGEAREKQIAQLMVEAQTLEPLSDLDPVQLKTLLQNYIRVLVLDPTYQPAIAGKQKTLLRASDSAKKALENNNRDRYTQFYTIIDSNDPGHASLNELQLAHQAFEKRQQQAQQALQHQQQINDLLEQAQKAAEANQLTAPPDSSALHFYRQVLTLDPNNAQAAQGIEAISNRYITMAQRQLLDKKPDKAKEAISKVEWLNPNSSQLVELKQQYQVIVQQVEQERKLAAEQQARKKAEAERAAMLADPLTQLKINSKLNAARMAYAENRLVPPQVDNALDKYREVLDIDPSHQGALDGIGLVQSKLVSLVRDAIQNGQKADAEKWLEQMRSTFAKHQDIPLLQQQISEMDLRLSLPAEPDTASEDSGTGQDNQTGAGISNTVEGGALDPGLTASPQSSQGLQPGVDSSSTQSTAEGTEAQNHGAQDNGPSRSLQDTKIQEASPQNDSSDQTAPPDPLPTDPVNSEKTPSEQEGGSTSGDGSTLG